MVIAQHKSVYLDVLDHAVSGESFQLLYNEDWDMLETAPAPNPKDLARYYQSEDYISHTDAKRNLFERAYQFVKQLLLRRKLKLIETYVQNDKYLLDIGCGTGDFLQIAQKHQWNVFGIEPNENARNIANSKTQNRVFDVQNLFQFDIKTFDIITLWHVLEHLPDLNEQFTQYKELLKPNGTLIVAVPNFKSHDAIQYKEFWAGYDVPRHLWHFSKSSITKLAQSHQMQVVDIFPMKFDAFYVCLLSEKYKSGIMNPILGFWNGLASNLKARNSGEYSSLIYVIKNKET